MPNKPIALRIGKLYQVKRSFVLFDYAPSNPDMDGRYIGDIHIGDLLCLLAIERLPPVEIAYRKYTYNLRLYSIALGRVGCYGMTQYQAEETTNFFLEEWSYYNPTGSLHD